GRSERCVLATLDAVDRALACLSGARDTASPRSEPPTSFDTAAAQLADRPTALLGPSPKGHSARIMLTIPEDADSSAIEHLLAEGAQAVRINCAKGNREAWQSTIATVRLAEHRHGRKCRIICDLAGPNPRTLDLEDREPDDVIGRVRAGDFVR